MSDNQTNVTSVTSGVQDHALPAIPGNENKSTAPAPAGGESIDAYIAHLKEETGVTYVLLKIEPIHPAAANSTGSGTIANGVGDTFNSIEGCVAHLKNETGATATMSTSSNNESTSPTAGGGKPLTSINESIARIKQDPCPGLHRVQPASQQQQLFYLPS
ncbi:hypothetical protein FOXYS1_6786 [Fusarium oxysporum]|uniref:Uncharacterized protein n=1 Tax=Fusarium oxysporum TaxID=5507 RepID=A0A8H5ACV0_FUSOX|nr:hypothetical protein FOXYS1_6786 [Fusarium oxysporum]